MTYLDFSAGDFDSVWDFIQAYGETYQDIYCYSKEGASETPLLMKLDVKADLMPMLDGFDELITGCRPLLALCVDDGYDTVWMAAKRISGMDPSYRFYLRYYGGNLIPTKYVLFAL